MNKRIANKLVEIAKELQAASVATGRKTAVRQVMKNIYDVDDVKNDEDLKEKVLDRYREINVEDTDWYDYVVDYYIEKLEKMGFEDVDIKFSGFWSQGNGASFTGSITGVDLVRLLKISVPRIILKEFDDIDLVYTIKRHGRYFHENSTHVDYEFEDSMETPSRIGEQYAEDMEKKLKKWMADYNQDIYRDLEKDYSVQTSDKAVFDTLEANDYEFDEDGKIV